ncbi:MAG: right-handed parallel beta-helix repeat-containing protein [Planctomycetaceae bacterium]
MIGIEPTPRFLIVRTLGLSIFIGLYAFFFGGETVGIHDLPLLQVDAVATEPVTESASLPAEQHADATEIITRLLNPVAGQPTSVTLPPGTYRLTRTIDVDLSRSGTWSLHGNGTVRLLMEGAGPALRLHGTHTGTADPKTVKPEVWERERMPLIDGIEIIGRHPEACGVELVQTMQPTLTRVTVRECLHGIHLVTRNRNVQISDCHLYNNRGVGIYLDSVNLHQINIVGCHISYNRQGGIVCRNSEIRNLQIGTCDIEGNMGDDQPPTANILLDCRQGSVREGAIVGCTLQHNRHSPDSANIRFLGQNDENRLMVGIFSIANNVLSDVRVNVHLQYARGVVLTGNTFWEGFDHNLLLEGCNDIVIGENLFDRNPDYKEETSTNTLRLVNCRDCSLSGLHVHDVHGEANQAALTLDHCQWVTLRNSMFLDNANGAVELRSCADCQVTDCAIRDNPSAGNNSPRIPPILDKDGRGNLIR